MTATPGPRRRGPPWLARWFGWRSEVRDIADDVRSIQAQLEQLTEMLPDFESRVRAASGRPWPPDPDPAVRKET